MAIIDKIKAKAKANVKHIVLPEGEEIRNIQAAAMIVEQGLAKLTLLGNPDKVKEVAAGVNLEGVAIIDPATSEKSAEYANMLFEIRKAKGMTEEQAANLVKDPMYYGVMMVKAGDADGLVSGAIHSTGDMLRAAVKAGTPLGQKAKSFMDAGDLVPDDVIIGLVTERLQDPDTEKGFILDGFPRTSAQAVALDAELSKLGRPLDAALLVDVDPEVIVKRLTSRRMCRDCNYIGTAADETCPKCGGEMYQRDDDNEATVRNRLDVYEKSTAPLIDYYRGCDLLVSIDGDRDPNVVYADVKQALGL